MRLVLGVFVAALVLTSCGNSDQADIPSIEKEIKAGLKDQTGARSVSVDCPDQIDWNAGQDFHCFAKDEQGNSVRVTVSMENDSGDWSWVVG